MGRAYLVRLIAVASVAVSACTVHETEIPRLIGPSELATSIEITASPDHVRQDGASQSTVAVRARDAAGQPIAAMGIRFEMSVGGTPQDYGTLSARNAVTGSDGRATVVYTSPATPAGGGGSGMTIEIVATNVGTNAQSAQSQSVSINLVPPGVILPPGGTPTASFTISPTPVSVGSSARFDASSSRPGSNATQLTYAWSFGDGETASGIVVNHSFGPAGSYSVTLTVTNDRGLSSTSTQTVVVAAAALPTADFVFSPSTPAPLDRVVFNAQPSTAGAGRTIVQYLWNWGDGDPDSSGIVQDHDYVSKGNYTVVLTVVDDLGQRDTEQKTVTVAVAPTTPGGPARGALVR